MEGRLPVPSSMMMNTLGSQEGFEVVTASTVTMMSSRKLFTGKEKYLYECVATLPE